MVRLIHLKTFSTQPPRIYRLTGFGLLGHLFEVCEGSGLSAIWSLIKFQNFPFLEEYIQPKSLLGRTLPNWESHGSKISAITHDQRASLDLAALSKLLTRKEIRIEVF